MIGVKRHVRNRPKYDCNAGSCSRNRSFLSLSPSFSCAWRKDECYFQVNGPSPHGLQVVISPEHGSMLCSVWQTWTNVPSESASLALLRRAYIAPRPPPHTSSLSAEDTTWSLLFYLNKFKLLFLPKPRLSVSLFCCFPLSQGCNILGARPGILNWWEVIPLV